MQKAFRDVWTAEEPAGQRGAVALCNLAVNGQVMVRFNGGSSS